MNYFYSKLNQHLFKFYKFIFIIPFLISCGDLIEYSPYKAGVRVPEKDLNIRTLNKLQQKSSSDFSPFSIGLITDTHTYYDYFIKQIELLNSKVDIDFVVNTGDITLSGIYREFVWYADIISNLKHPILTVIGNHEYLSNGEFMFKEMFGPSNFKLVYNNCLLIFFDNVIWEKNVEDPDFDWLEDVLASDFDYKYKVVFSHIPPWSASFSKGNEYYFNMLVDKYNVDLSVHGHNHRYTYEKRYDIGPYYLTVPSSQKGEVFFLDFLQDSLAIRREYY